MILLSPAAVEDLERLRTFLDTINPGAAKRALTAIWTAIERLPDVPSLGTATEDADIRQIVVRFGSSGYIVRYAVIPETGDILITRLYSFRAIDVSLVMFLSRMRPRWRSRIASLRQV